MTGLDEFRVVPFAKSEYTPASRTGPPLFTWREFYTFRNELLRVLRPYGTVGPMGEMPILDDWESSKEAWGGGASNPEFFVVDDMWNEYDRWNRVEASPWLVTTDVLRQLVTIVQRWPGWCVYLALVRGGLTVLGNRILYEGELFVDAGSIEDLGQRCTATKQ